MKKDFLSMLDLAPADLEELFAIADLLKVNRSIRPLERRCAALIFQKPSLRTRVSFEVGIIELGGHPIFLSQEEVGIGVREAASDVARTLSRINALIVARLYDHRLLEELARHSSVPVINALTDYSHPCQVLADLYTMRQHGKLRPGVKVAFVGDGNNVVHSWLESSMIYRLHVALAAPDGYRPDPDLLERALASQLSRVEVFGDPAEAVRSADVVYTDVWTSMGQEAEAEERRRAFAGYTVDERLLSLARPDAIVMHCLPAHRGEEIAGTVLDGSQSVVFDQAENRLHVQKAVMVRLLAGMDGVPGMQRSIFLSKAEQPS